MPVHKKGKKPKCGKLQVANRQLYQLSSVPSVRIKTTRPSEDGREKNYATNDDTFTHTRSLGTFDTRVRFL